MTTHHHHRTAAGWGRLGWWPTIALLLASCGSEQQDEAIPVGSLVLGQHLAAEALHRPAVVFDHDGHAAELGKQESCKRCHERDPKDRLRSTFIDTAITSADARMEAYHERCIGCHQERRRAGEHAGPVTCGDCHREHGVTAASERDAIRFDYSLHNRHLKSAQDRCEACHHVYDEQAGKLIYRKGTESACGDCHGEVPAGKTPSHRQAAHVACVGCHLKTTGATGPTTCAGCHDPAVRAGYKKIADPARLLRGQPSATWIHIPTAHFGAVAFNHEAHEPAATSCSGCHHRTLQACDHCHSLTGKQEGKQITLEQAYHDGKATQSCVGCHHQKASRSGDCAGCHRALPAGPSEASCTLCHDGPGGASRRDPDPSWGVPVRSPVELDPLTATGDGLPEAVRIDVLADRYGPSSLPHLKIVRRLDAAVRASALARRFHGRSAALCIGCHHHSPIGQRPPACTSCHSRTAAAESDRPALKAAYHRQCMGCHEAMNLKQGCTDCHPAKETQP